MQQIPYEVYAHIMSHTNKETQHACCLVSHAWLDPARQRLCRTLYLVDQRTHKDVVPVAMPPEMRDHISRLSSVARYCNSLCVRGYRVIYEGRNALDHDLDLVAPALGQRVTTLTIKQCGIGNTDKDPPSPEPSNIILSQYFPHLASLVIQGCLLPSGLWLMQMLLTCPTLEHIALDHAQPLIWGGNGHLMTDQLWGQLPHLKTFQIDRSGHQYSNPVIFWISQTSLQNLRGFTAYILSSLNPRAQLDIIRHPKSQLEILDVFLVERYSYESRKGNLLQPL
jgi:hypothetical protein